MIVLYLNDQCVSNQFGRSLAIIPEFSAFIIRPFILDIYVAIFTVNVSSSFSDDLHQFLTVNDGATEPLRETGINVFILLRKNKRNMQILYTNW